MQIGKILKKCLNKKDFKIDIKRLDVSLDDTDYDRGIKKLMNLLNYTKKV